LTRQAFAEFLGTELRFSGELFQKIQDFFSRRSLKMRARSKTQAYLPTGAKALPNDLGTAPGIMAEIKDKLLIAMPGVPSEMKQMFEISVMPRLQQCAAQQAFVVRKLNCFGAGESEIAQSLGTLMQRGRNPLINCTAKQGQITLHIFAQAANKSRAQQIADNDEKLLQEKLGQLVFSTEDKTLAEVVGEKLAQHNKTIALAESCTGGTLAKLLTDIPGASRYFTHGWITYSNSAKTSQLGVPAALIEKHGAVSSEVATAMAQGARKRAKSDLSVAITGIAGPAGGSEQKPVGLVYICVNSHGRAQTKRFVFSHDRDYIRLRAALTALNMLRLKL
jgi:nicotinamide-nucleotide amidase